MSLACNPLRSLLSRQGVLLLNISLVEPGYEGYLTTVLVNFGNKNVVISPTTTIAKVAFFIPSSTTFGYISPSTPQNCSERNRYCSQDDHAPSRTSRDVYATSRYRQERRESLLVIDETSNGFQIRYRIQLSANTLHSGVDISCIRSSI